MSTVLAPSALRQRESARTFTAFVPLREAAGASIDEQARTARVQIITEGLGNLKDRNFYTPSAIESSVQAFEGKQFYLDHPSQSEEEDRPERSVRDLAGFFSDCKAGSTEDADTGEKLAACFATLHFADSDPGRLAFDQVKTALDYQKRYPQSKDVYAGISINAGGVSHPGTIEGMQVNMVTKIAEAFSADIVTKPARGGKFLAQTRESVVGDRAGIAARVAAWQRHHGRESGRPQRARVALREERQMATIIKPRRTLTEAERTKLTEAFVGKLKGSDITALKEADESALLALAQDLLQDAGNLVATLQGGGTPAPNAPGDEPPGDEPQAEGEGEEEGEGEGEEEGEGGMPGANDMGMGMTDEGDEGEGEGDGGQNGAMKYTCEGCGRENEVLPPKGFNLMRSAESRSGARPPRQEAPRPRESSRGGAHDILVGKLQRQLEAKETRFREAKGNERHLLRENIRLRAEVHAVEIERQAGQKLREARVPRDILSVADLVAYHPSQWDWQIKVATDMLARESRRGGMNHRESDGRPLRETTGRPTDAADWFTQNYPRGDR